MTIAPEVATSFTPCMPGCNPQTCHDCTDQGVARQEQEMLKFMNIHTTFGEFELLVTTDYNCVLGWTTQIHGGSYDKKIWVAKTRKRADYHHRIAVEMVINSKYKVKTRDNA